MIRGNGPVPLVLTYNALTAAGLGRQRQGAVSPIIIRGLFILTLWLEAKYCFLNGTVYALKPSKAVPPEYRLLYRLAVV